MFRNRLVLTTLALGILALLLASRPQGAAGRAASPALTTVIPYSSDGLKYLVVAQGTGAGFEQVGFDDSAFLVGLTPFGFAGGGGCFVADSSIRTIWPANTDILVRKEFVLPADFQDLRVGIAIDNDIQVFVNGHDISGVLTHGGCPSQGDFLVHVPHILLHAGTNLIAIRGHDRGASTFLDFEVISAPVDLGISWWQAENNANDSVGSNHGELRNGASFTTGKVAQGFRFDGVDDYINVPDSPSLDSISTAITVESWINPEVPTAPALSGEPVGRGAIFARRTPNVIECFTVSVRNDGRLRLDASTTISGLVFISVEPVIQFDNQWKHVAATADTANGMAKLYLNGQEVALTSIYNSFVTGQLASANGLYIGHRQPIEALPFEGAAGAAAYKGLIDEVRLYNRALSASEMLAHYNTVAPPPPPSPVLTVSTNLIDFGKVPRGGFKDLSFTITNDGSGLLEGSVSYTSPFSITGPTGGPFSLTSGQSITQTVTFNPQAIASYAKSLNIFSNVDPVSVTVNGEGVEAVAVILAHGIGGSSRSFSADGGLHDWVGNGCPFPEAVSRPECQPRMGQLLQEAGLLVAQPFDYHEKTSGPLNFKETGWAIEELAGELHKHIEYILRGEGVDINVPGFRFPRGTPVSRVDVVGHSMGGLITRAYISDMAIDKAISCLSAPGQPITCNKISFNGKIRKFVTVGTPHYGSQFAEVVGNRQGKEMRFGSEFVLSLHENWRNVGHSRIPSGNILVIAGTLGEGLLQGDDDGVVNIGSAALPIDFLPNAGQIGYVPYWHGELKNISGTTIIGVNDIGHLTYQFVRQFLLGRPLPVGFYTPPPDVTQRGLLLVRFFDRQTGKLITRNLKLSALVLPEGVHGQSSDAGAITVWPLVEGFHTVGLIDVPKPYAPPPAPIAVFIDGRRPRVLDVMLERR